MSSKHFFFLNGEMKPSILQSITVIKRKPLTLMLKCNNQNHTNEVSYHYTPSAWLAFLNNI